MAAGAFALHRSAVLHAGSAGALVDPASGSATSAARFFWVFLGAHVVVWTLAPMWLQPNRPLDMIEMLYWGQYGQWGYYKHPPLPAWICAWIEQVSLGMIWPFYLAAQLIVATSFWAAWRLAKEFVAPWQAVCASLLLETSIHYNLATTDLNNSIIEQPLWALSVLFLYWAVTRGRLAYWIASGTCLGLGMLSKYDIAMLAISMLVLAAVNPRARAALRTSGPWAMLAVSVAIFWPHVVWMQENDFPTLNYLRSRSHNARSWFGHVLNPIEFLLAQLLVHLPMLGVAASLWWPRRQRRATESDRFQRDFLLLMGLGPLVLDLLASAISGAQLKSMWGAPMWTFSGLLLVYACRSTTTLQACRATAWGCVAAGALILAIFAGRNSVLPHWRGKASRVHFPGASLARTIEAEWRRHSDASLEVVGGSWWTAANIGLHARHRPLMFDFAEPPYSPWAGDEDLRRHGGVLIWEDDQYAYLFEAQRELRFPDALVLPILEVRWETSADIAPARFHLAIVSPPDDGRTDTAKSVLTSSRAARRD